ncbi:MAG TPA: thioesterase domain-containing protein, partial [Verrucomicrobiae bacterium]|nr:thioesterase domain-containing protein [Verrucomicrobiae bacterium]
SLSATQLIARLRATLKMELPLRSIFIAPTIAELAKHIRYDALTKTFHPSSEIPRWNCLVPIQPRGSRPPLFLVGGAHADEDALLRFLAHLIPHIGLDQPVYGFKPRGLDGQAQPQSSVEEIARDYLAEVREFLPDGPYLLAGECVGGVVAFEMAQQLRRQGQDVALLALLDTERPTSWRAFQSRLRSLNRATRYRVSRIQNILRSPPKLWWRLFVNFISPNIRAHFPRSHEDRVLGRIREVENGYARLTFRYRAQPYPGRVALIVNEQAHTCDADLGWSGVPQEGLDIYRVPGNHVTRLTLHGKIVANRLLKCIDEARQERDQAAAERDSVSTKPAPNQGDS